MSRARARELAEAARRDGQPLRWFEELYAEGERGEAVVPWADLVPNPLMVSALAGDDLTGRAALVVGCGLGDDAAWLAERGARVTAFDIAPTAVRQAAARFVHPPPASGGRFAGHAIDWQVADVLALPPAWRGAFDLVVEISTLQCLPAELRPRALAELAGTLRPGGELLAIARAREPDESAGTMPWPLTRAELTAVESLGCRVESLADVLDAEDPPVRRFVMRAGRAPRG